MVALLIAAALALMPLYDSEALTGPVPSASKSTASTAQTRAPLTVTPVAVPIPDGIEITHSCQKDYLTYETYTTLEELWALPGGGGNSQWNYTSSSSLKLPPSEPMKRRSNTRAIGSLHPSPLGCRSSTNSWRLFVAV